MKPSGKTPQEGWLIFFYRVTAKPVNNRVRIWRRLARAGAVQLKGSVYILPYSEDHFELLQWLSTEVRSLKGDAAFARTDRIETMTGAEVRDLFNQQRSLDYQGAAKALEEIERRLASIGKGAGITDQQSLESRLEKIGKEFMGIRNTDFFLSGPGTAIDKRIRKARLEMKQYFGMARPARKPEVETRETGNYRKKTWLTRKNPFVDRMASAWLIRRFVDPEATFAFLAQEDPLPSDKKHVTFDMSGAEFTHQADLCTFEVLVRAFGIKDKAVRKIAQIVHELDIKDEKYKTPQARGLEEILSGIRKTASNDAEALEKGMAVFEMLYVSTA